MCSLEGAHTPAPPTEPSAPASDLATKLDTHSIAFPNTYATTGSRSGAARALGFEQVYPDPKDANVTAETKIDVIALHGLDAESPKTWEAWKDGQTQDSGSVFWLADKHMLPWELPKARILAYNWNASFAKDASSDIFFGHAETLLDRLHLDRKKNSRLNYPIIFIASCFGGLLLAKALLRATDEVHRNKYREIIYYTVGVAFLGTPFQGSWECGNIVAEARIKSAETTGDEYSRELVEYLRTGDPHKPGPLAELVRRFTELISHDCFNFKVACFYETRDTHFSAKLQKLPQDYVPKELDSNRHGIVVSMSSACLHGAECVPLDVRHNMMHKFNHPTNDSYLRLVERLQNFAEGADKVLEKNREYQRKLDRVKTMEDTMSTPTFAFTRTPYKKDDVPLASLVPDKDYLNQDMIANVKVEEGEDYSVTIDVNFHTHLRVASGSVFKTALERVFSVLAKGEEKYVVKAEHARTYELLQPTATFARLCEQDAVRKWLQERHRWNRKSYFIVGYCTLVDAKFIREMEQSTASAHMAVDLPMASGVRRNTAVRETLMHAGERIYAVCYRSVRLSYYKKSARANSVSGNRWKNTFARRGGNNVEFVEASLEEDLFQEVITLDGVGMPAFSLE